MAIEFDKSDTWNPPEHWVYGHCQGCKRKFFPKLPKQYYCHSCRNFDNKPTPAAIEAEKWISSMPEKNAYYIQRVANPGRIRTAMFNAGIYSYKKLARMIGCSDSMLSDWNAGAKPGSLDKSLRLAKALNTTLEKLFSADAMAHLRKLMPEAL